MLEFETRKVQRRATERGTFCVGANCGRYARQTIRPDHTDYRSPFAWWDVCDACAARFIARWTLRGDLS